MPTTDPSTVSSLDLRRKRLKSKVVKGLDAVDCCERAWIGASLKLLQAANTVVRLAAEAGNNIPKQN